MQPNHFLRTWANFNQKYNAQLLYNTDDFQFYFLRKKLPEGMIEVSPLTLPTEKIMAPSNGFFTLDSYISANFGQISGENRENLEDVSANFANIRSPFDLTSNKFQKDLDAVLKQIREITQRVQKATKGRKTKSYQRAADLLAAGEGYYHKGDIEEMRYVLDRLNGLMGAINNIRNNAAKHKAKLQFKKYATLSAVAVVLIGSVYYAGIKGYATLKARYSIIVPAVAVNMQGDANIQYMHEGDNMHPDSISTIIHNNPKIMQAIDNYAKLNNAKIWNWRRAKIVYSVHRHPGKDIMQVIDSVTTKNYEAMKL